MSPRPTEAREHSVTPASTEARASVPRRGAVRWRSSAASVASAAAAPHSALSWYTDTWLASNRSTAPPVHANTKPPTATASRGPTGASPRTRLRTCHSKELVATTATTMASSIDTAASRPS